MLKSLWDVCEVIRVYAMKTCRWSGDVVSHILNSDIRWRLQSACTPPTVPQGKGPQGLIEQEAGWTL